MRLLRQFTRYPKGPSKKERQSRAELLNHIEKLEQSNQQLNERLREIEEEREKERQALIKKIEAVPETLQNCWQNDMAVLRGQLDEKIQERDEETQGKLQTLITCIQKAQKIHQERFNAELSVLNELKNLSQDSKSSILEQLQQVLTQQKSLERNITKKTEEILESELKTVKADVEHMKDREKKICNAVEEAKITIDQIRNNADKFFKQSTEVKEKQEILEQKIDGGIQEIKDKLKQYIAVLPKMKDFGQFQKLQQKQLRGLLSSQQFHKFTLAQQARWRILQKPQSEPKKILSLFAIWLLINIISNALGNVWPELTTLPIFFSTVTILLIAVRYYIEEFGKDPF